MKKLKLPNLQTLLFPLVLLALSPAIYFTYDYFITMQDLDFFEERIEMLQRKTLSMDKKNAAASFENADHFYFDKHLETFVFLESEIKTLQAHSFQQDQTQLQRLDFLQNNNKLLFAEESIQRSGRIQETFERQQRAIECNEEDLKKLLCLIEGVSISSYRPKENRPELIIQDFEISKKPSKVYQVNMNILKREPLPADGKP